MYESVIYIGLRTADFAKQFQQIAAILTEIAFAHAGLAVGMNACSRGRNQFQTDGNVVNEAKEARTAGSLDDA